MDHRMQRFERRREKLVRAYRYILCIASAAALCLCAVYKTGDHFTPENLRSITLGKEITFSLVSAKEKKYLPKNTSLYEDELYLVEQKGDAEEKADTNTEVMGGDYPITPLDISGGAAKGEVLINDSGSGVTVDIAELLKSPTPEALQTGTVSELSTNDKPTVLIIHTHATECYSEEGAQSYSDSTSFRTEDKSKNMIAVGKVLCDTLNSHGISSIHCETLHDAEDYNSSYPNSLESVKYYLEKYPSIKYVFDLHRDAIIRENGELIKTSAVSEPQDTAQVMTLVGTNTAGADHPEWRVNLNFALKLQQRLTESHPGIARPVNLRSASFNQQYAPGSLLFEIGSCGNTLNEAKRAAVLLGEELAELIK